MRHGLASSSSGVRSPVPLPVQVPVGEVPATAPLNSPLRQWYRSRWMGGVSRLHIFPFKSHSTTLAAARSATAPLAVGWRISSSYSSSTPAGIEPATLTAATGSITTALRQPNYLILHQHHTDRHTDSTGYHVFISATERWGLQPPPSTYAQSIVPPSDPPFPAHEPPGGSPVGICRLYIASQRHSNCCSGIMIESSIDE